VETVEIASIAKFPARKSSGDCISGLKFRAGLISSFVGREVGRSVEDLETGSFSEDVAETTSAFAPPPVPRKRGRPKGYPKTGGRVKGTPNISLSDLAAEAEILALEVMKGQQVYAGPSGSVGKPGWRYPSMEQRIKVALHFIDKKHPGLSAVAVDQKVTSIDKAPNSLDLARAIFDVFRDANGGMPNSDDVAPGPVRFSSVEPGGAIDDGSALRPKPGEAPAEIGETIVVGDRGDGMQLVEISRDGRERWLLLRRDGEELGLRWGRDEARAALEEFVESGRMSA
jgi:hypothetical protein